MLLISIVIFMTLISPQNIRRNFLQNNFQQLIYGVMDTILNITVDCMEEQLYDVWKLSLVILSVTTYLTKEWQI